MPKTSQAQQKAVQRYVSKTYDRAVVTMPKGMRADVKSAAETAGMSMNAYFVEAVTEKMKKRQA